MIHQIYFKNKEFKIDVKKVGYIGKFTGLMLKSSGTDNLLFEFKKDVGLSIHSLFVFFSFLAVWVDENNKVVDFKLVKPFRFSVKSKKEFRRLIEIPVNRKNDKLISYFVGEL